MSKPFTSYRELIADALSPKPPARGTQDALIATNLQFTPSAVAVRKADEVGLRLRSAEAERTG